MTSLHSSFSWAGSELAPCPFTSSTVMFFSSLFLTSSSPTSFSLICDVLGSLLSLDATFSIIPTIQVLKKATKLLNTSPPGLQKSLLKLIANNLHGNATLLSALTSEDIYTVLNSTSSEPILGLREYAIIAVKAICENEENAKIVEGLRAQAVKQSEEMNKLGVDLKLGEDGKVKVDKALK